MTASKPGEPPESILRGLVPEDTWIKYTYRQRLARRCYICHRTYRLGNFAWDCEHWHGRNSHGST